jgi:uncharacterized protein YndB with AHSA1/START domain
VRLIRPYSHPVVRAGVEVDRLEEGEWLRLTALIPARSPQEIWRDWPEPDRVHAWWAAEASIDLRVGGSYRMHWPTIPATLHGEYVRIEPECVLEFTWAWEHDPTRRSTVRLEFEPRDDGTQLRVTHGPYADTPEDRQLRNDHRDGWLHHLPKFEA